MPKKMKKKERMNRKKKKQQQKNENKPILVDVCRADICKNLLKKNETKYVFRWMKTVLNCGWI